jgi:hypothetical protein
MATTKKLRYALDEDQHLANWETGADIEYEDLPQAEPEQVTDSEYELGADPDYDESVQAEYEQAADPDYGDEVVTQALEPAQEEVEATAPFVVTQPAEGFTYELGRAVLPVTQAQPHPVVWRGYLKERHPETGLVQRVPVYRLDDGFWDCYREDELRVA